MDFSRIKSFAKSKLKEQYGLALLFTLILSAAALLYLLDNELAIIFGTLITPALSLSHANMNIALLASNRLRFGHLTYGFRDWWSAFKLHFFSTLYIYLWTLLFIIPGIVHAFAYSQAMYILASNPKMGAHECLRRSKALMKGHKREYFRLILSFLGWFLLCIPTFGLLLIWVIPYLNATLATFYISILPDEEASAQGSVTVANEAPEIPEIPEISEEPAAPRKKITFGNGGEENGSNAKL